MGKFTGLLLISDFDNTLVDTASAFRRGEAMPLPGARTREALGYFMDQGGQFAVATGRALASFAPFAASVPMNAPAVLCNGAALYDFSAGEYLETNCLNDAIGRRIQPVLDRYPQVAAEAYHLGNTIYAVQPNQVTKNHEHITHVVAAQSSSLLEVPSPLGKLLLEGDHEMLEEIRQLLLRQDWSDEYELVFSDPILLELTAKGANKGGMVARLAQRLKISRENIICVGDEANDLSMLHMAGKGFAPANCVEAVRRSGVRIVADAAHDALAQVVEILDNER